MLIKKYAVLLALVLCVSSSSKALEKVALSFKDFADDIADLKHLSYFPQHHYKLIQYSSYDRRSSVHGGSDWFENADGFGNEPIPGFEKVLTESDENGIGRYLICDVQSPGVIVRTWSAQINGTIEMYLDGDNKPAYKGSAYDFFLKPYVAWSKKITGIDEQILAEAFQQQDACYFPIPFEKRCKIIWEGKKSGLHFYQIQIREYSDDVLIETITPENIVSVKDISRKLMNPDTIIEDSLTETTFDYEIDPENKKDIFVEEGRKAIYELRLKLEAQDIVAALRQSVLTI